MIQERISLTWFFVLQQRERWTSALFPLKLKDRRNSLLAIFLSILFHRLVLDRETGKPKGYGFCEFRDEETALSLRRNLQGYEVNGRQLWVDFAENEKGGNGERNQDQVLLLPLLSYIVHCWRFCMDSLCMLWICVHIKPEVFSWQSQFAVMFEISKQLQHIADPNLYYNCCKQHWLHFYGSHLSYWWDSSEFHLSIQI
jgi:hypothetical protein